MEQGISCVPVPRVWREEQFEELFGSLPDPLDCGHYRYYKC